MKGMVFIDEIAQHFDRGYPSTVQETMASCVETVPYRFFMPLAGMII
jgi:hypothetical protein